MKLIKQKTAANFNCKQCHFKEKGIHCPQGNKYPLCFAQENGESIYFKLKKQ